MWSNPAFERTRGSVVALRLAPCFFRGGERAARRCKRWASQESPEMTMDIDTEKVDAWLFFQRLISLRPTDARVERSRRGSREASAS